MNDSTTKTTAPALPCPAWCESSHAGEFAGTSHQLHRDFSDGAGFVTLYMGDNGVSGPEVLAYLNGRVSLHVTWRDPDSSVIRPLAEAEQLAQLAEAFGRPVIAAIIRELAALGGAEKPRLFCAPTERPWCPDHRPIHEAPTGWYCAACGAEAPPDAAAPGPAGGAQ